MAQKSRKKKNISGRAGERQARSPASFRANLAGSFFLPLLLVLLSFVFMRSAKDPTLVRLPVAALFTAAAAFFLAFKARPLNRAARSACITLAAYFAWAAVAAVFSFFPPAAAGGLSRLLIYFSLFLVAAHLPYSRALLPTWIFCGLVLCVMALLDAHRAGVMVYLPLMERGMPRFVTPLGNRNFFAGYIALLLPVTVAFALRQGFVFARGRIVPGVAGRMFYGLTALSAAILAAGFVFMLVKVGSRAALGGALFSVLLLLLVFAWFYPVAGLRNRGLRIAGRICLFVLLLGSLGYGAIRSMPVVQGEIRRHIFVGTINMIRSRPWAGYGPGAYLAGFQQFRPPDYYLGPAAPVSDQSHNELLQVASETGVPALVLYLATLLLVFVAGWRALGRLARKTRARDGPGERPFPLPVAESPGDRWFLLAGFLCGVTALLADGLLSSNLRTHTVGPLFWVTLGLCALLANPGEEGAGQPDKPVRGTSGPRAFWFSLGVLSLIAGVVLSGQVASRVYHNRGILHRHRQNWRAAAWYYRRALDYDPSYLQGYYRLGYVLYEQGDVEGAIDAYRRLVESSPNFAKVYMNLANMYLVNEEPEKAAFYLRRSLSYNPHDQDAAGMLKIAERRLARNG